MARERTQRYISMRRTHPAWLLLASPKGPLMLACLKTLTEAHPSGVDFEEAVERLAAAFADHANDSEFELGDDHALTARRELRQWLKRGLIVERNGQLLATDALQRSQQFVDSLEDRTMTSTASRLATVQRAIETLESQLSPSQVGRETSLKMRIEALETELAAVQAGHFEVLDGPQAEEGIREVYQLAVSLQADFRRVEDSYRLADRILRERIISENQNRGEIVDELLNGHDALVQTVEGQVFESFHAQLVKTVDLDAMKARLRSILENENTDRALLRKQKAELRQLVSRLVQESERVIQARARSERDVRGFLKSGLIDEQIRVGALLHEIQQVALDVDWQSQQVRRLPAPLPPIAIATSNLPIIERLLVKQLDQTETGELELAVNEADPANIDEEFWHAYHALNRAELFEKTIAHLRANVDDRALSIGDLARALPPTHDLETLAYWLSMARQAGIPIADECEPIDLHHEDDGWTRFHVPGVELTQVAVENLEAGSLE
ncbi:MAG: DUF3375 family protein [Pirellulaceae bacterium]|nr:DUF3375 family protein [Planctomycetales bacterium]